MEITVSEASTRWGITRQTIYKKIRQGKLSQLQNKKIDVVDFEIETLSEEMQKQKRIEELKAELRKLTAFSF